jgi:flagellar hook-associated protein 2
MSMGMRITGTNSGLDVDSLVTASMKPYKARVDKEVQNRKVLEYQQEQYRTIMNDAADFYDKYFDVLKTGNLISSSTYQTQTYTASNGSVVTAKGLAGASLDNYSVNVGQLAAKASDSLGSSDIGDVTIKIGSVPIETFKAVSDGTVTVSNYNTAIANTKKSLSDIINGTGTTAEKDLAKSQLDELNKNTVTAKYSEFSKKVTFTSDAFGGNGFTVSVKKADNSIIHNARAEDKYLEATVKNSKGEVYTITSADKKTSNNVTIDNVVFDFKGVSSSTTNPGVAGEVGEVLELAGDVTPVGELTALGEKDGTTTKETSADGTTTVKTKAVDGTETVTVTLKDGTTTITTTKGNIKSVTDQYGITTTDTSNVGFTLTTVKSGKTTTTTKTNSDGTIPVTKKKETSSDGTTTTTTTIKDGDTTTVKKDVYDGTDTLTTTTTEKETSDGSTITIAEAKNNVPTKITTTKIQVDPTTGITTKSVSIKGSGNKDVTTYGSPSTLTGGTDVKDLKDKIVNFVNDYNKILTEINTKLFETRDKDYMPLTDEQKKSMTDDQIKSWEKKAQTGLLRKDNDLERIAREMKSAMATVMSGSGLSLEKIGISPVKNYTDKNGMLTINEDKLTTALQENGGDVKDLFMRKASGTDMGGALTQLKSALYSEFKSSSSSLSKKVGLVGSSTENDNTITKNITTKKKLIYQLNSQLTTRENALYKKYSALETAMGQLNNQKSSLASMLGQG